MKRRTKRKRRYATRRNRGRRYRRNHQTSRARGTATDILHDGGMITVTYHGTPVVKFDDKKIILNTGGYKTATTKTRMNQAANQFGLGYKVEQKHGGWGVMYKGYPYLFGGSVLTLKR